MDRILTIDVGNTNIVVGSFQCKKLEAVGRFETTKKWTVAAFAQELSRFLYKEKIPMTDVDGSILSSVVPDLNPILSDSLKEVTGKSPLLMRTDLETGIRTEKYDLSLVGTDRIVDMAAAAELYGTPVAIWDLGTATTLSVVNNQKYFIGGMISAGVQLSLHALSEHTAQLPDLQAEAPASLLGLDTKSNMISGSAAATGIMIEGVAARLEQQTHLEGLHVVLTGGLGRLVLPWINRKVIYNPDLQLEGLRAIYCMNVT